MGQLTVTVNGRQYDLKCDDGQEDHVRALASLVNQRVDGLVATVGQVGEGRLLLLAALVLQDELTELQGRLHGPRRPEEGTAAEAAAVDGIVTALEDVVVRIEQVADRLGPA
jgi:cell division protein ZapA